MPAHDHEAQDRFNQHNQFLQDALAKVHEGAKEDDYEVLGALIDESRSRLEQAQADFEKAKTALLDAEGEVRTLEAIDIGTYHALISIGM